MNNTLSRNRSTESIGDVIESSVAPVVSQLLGHRLLTEPVGLEAAGINPAALVVTLLGNKSVDLSELFVADPDTAMPEGAKRKAADEDEEEDEEEDDDVSDDEEEDEDEEDADEDDELDDDEDEEDDDDDDDEEDDEFDDPDDDDDYDDDDDEDDFDDE